MTRKEINDYAHELSTHLFHNVKLLGGYVIDMDQFAGSLFIANEKGHLYCSPLWDGDESGICIAWYPTDDAPKKEDVLTLPFAPTFDLEADKTEYIRIMTDYLKTCKNL